MFKYYLGGSGAPRIPSFCITWTSCILTPILCITFKNFSVQCMAQLFWETKMKKKKRYKKFTLTVQSYISAHLCTFSPHGWEALPNLAYLSMYSKPFSYKGGCWKDIYFLRSAHPMSSFRSFLLNVQEFTTKVEGDLFLPHLLKSFCWWSHECNLWSTTLSICCSIAKSSETAKKRHHIQREAIIKCTTLMYHDIV